MADWMLEKLSDYWDSRAHAVFTSAQRLEAIERGRRALVLGEISQSVLRHADALTSRQLEGFAWVMVDDLYRGLDRLSYWDDSISDYLEASAGTFCQRLASLGYSIRYFIDNDFEQTEIGMAGPAEWYGGWFRSAGLAYICPQEIARKKIVASGAPCAQWTDLLPAHLDSARMTALDSLRACRNVRSHFVYLDAQSSENALDLGNEDAGIPGSILVMRNEDPRVSSRCLVFDVTPPRG